MSAMLTDVAPYLRRLGHDQPPAPTLATIPKPQQIKAFLEAGGPKRDRKGLDPDGDGFACAWDPRPFRLQ